MTLSGKYRKYLVVIAALAMILGIKTITGPVHDEEYDGTSGDELALVKYTLDADVEMTEPALKDIFTGNYLRDAHENGRQTFRNGTARIAPITQQSPHQKGNQPQPPVNDGEIDRLKLLGTVFHDNKRKAFIALDRQRVIADVGELVYGRYLLKEIAVDSASLIDTKENVSKTILVSGK